MSPGEIDREVYALFSRAVRSLCVAWLGFGWNMAAAFWVWGEGRTVAVIAFTVLAGFCGYAGTRRYQLITEVAVRRESEET